MRLLRGLFMFVGMYASLCFANQGLNQSANLNIAHSPKAWAYQAWWLPQAWKSAPLKEFDRLLFFELRINASGEIPDKNGWPEKWSEFREAARKQHVPIDLTLTLLNAVDFVTLFSSDKSIQTLQHQIALLSADRDVSGIHLDVEVYTSIPAVILQRYRQFVSDLSVPLRKSIPAKHLSVFLPMGGETPLYDAKTLNFVDEVVVQAYDAHWTGSAKAGPVAPLDGNYGVTWKKAMTHAASIGLSADKVLLSYPFFGYEWRTKSEGLFAPTVGEGKQTTFTSFDVKTLPAVQINVKDRFKEHGAKNDRLSGSSFYQFKAAGQWRTGWFEGDWALQRKFEFLKDKRVGGVAFFVLGYDGGGLVDRFTQLRRNPEKSKNGI